MTDATHTADGELDLERLLRRALAPVEPPEDLVLRLEATLTDLTDLAAEELEGWELAAIRDPRNWPALGRPAAAVAIGGAAGAGLVVLRVRAGRRKRKVSASGDPLAYAAQTARALATEARREVRRLLPG